MDCSSIGILHFSDIHFKENNNFVANKKSNIVNAIKGNCYKLKQVFIVISGDVAFSGKKEEYEIAKNFIDAIVGELKTECKVEVEVIIAPGNHDCDFSKNNQSRENNLKAIRDNGDEAISDDVIETCTSIQNNFFDFSSKYNAYVNRLAVSQKFDCENECIYFNCYNTAWLSSKIEDPGTLFFPKKNIHAPNEKSIYVSVFHHPSNWFNPKTKGNNCREFSSSIHESSNIILSGHEHSPDLSKTENLIRGNESITIQGGELQGNGTNSEFNYMELDIANKILCFFHYQWNEEHELYSYSEKTPIIRLYSNYQPQITLRESFADFLNKTNIPLSKNDDTNIYLDDIYVYPKLEPLNSNPQKMSNFQDSSILQKVDIANYKYIIEGGEQAGKTSLCKMLYKYFVSVGYLPLYITGDKIKKVDYNKLIKDSFDQQYDSDSSLVGFQKFLQSNKKNKVILIDNLGHSKLEVSEQDKFINNLSLEYPNIIITVNDTYGIENLIKEKAELKDFTQFKIMEFGHLLRNQLIEKWKRIGEESNFDEQQILEYVDNTYRKINDILGINLMPAYPAYILILLQTLENYSSHDLDKTSYGHCYETLINMRLAQNNIKHDNLDSYFNFITELAFYMYSNNATNMLRSDIDNYKENSYSFIIDNNVVDDLITSGILTVDSLNSVSFKYKYIYYYFVARYLAQKNNDECKSIIANLCENIHINKNANILIFLTHHIKNYKLLDEILLSSMLIFDEVKEAHLRSEEIEFMKILSESVSKMFLENKDPKRERERRLERKDRDHKSSNHNEKLEEIFDNNSSFERELKKNNHSEDKFFIDINKSLKSIEVIGQIAKNRFGSIEQPKLLELIEEVCNTGLRTLNYFLDVFRSEETKDELYKIASEELKDIEDNVIKTREKIHQLFAFFGYFICHFFIHKIAHSTGIKQLEPCFKKLAIKHETPAYELIHFIIQTRYAKSISTDRLKELMKKYHKNILVKDILIKVVVDYIYMNKVNYADKQKISEIIEIPMDKQMIMENKVNK